MARSHRRSPSRQGFLRSPLVLIAFALIWVLWDKTQVQPVATEHQLGAFRVLEGAQLVENRGNDGDSFRLRHGDVEQVFRLYFVDTCEKSTRFSSRLKHQARYFGGLRQEQVTELGERARSVTLNWLREEPFHIHTRDESVMGSERHHAMIYFPKAPQENQRWLSQRLVAAGLARIYTKGTRLADGTSEAQFEAALKQLEAEAKAQEQGAWGL